MTAPPACSCAGGAFACDEPAEGAKMPVKVCEKGPDRDRKNMANKPEKNSEQVRKNMVNGHGKEYADQV